jgi:hypothetical protein
MYAVMASRHFTRSKLDEIIMAVRKGMLVYVYLNTALLAFVCPINVGRVIDKWKLDKTRMIQDTLDITTGNEEFEKVVDDFIVDLLSGPVSDRLGQ